MRKTTKPRQKFRRRKTKLHLIKDQKVDSQKGETQIDEKKQQATIKRRNRTIDALGLFAMGITVGYAPQYIETKNALIVNASQYGSLLFFMIGLSIIYWVHPNMGDYKHAWIFMPMIAIVFYWITTDPSVTQKVSLSLIHFFRFMSFMGLLGTVAILMANIPKLLDLYEGKKENIKALFSVKSILGFILGVLTMGTALFQFLQVLLSFFHR